MAGVEEKLGKDVYISDETEGIIPRVIFFIYFIQAKKAFRFLWQVMA